uniref:Uncharacterized protein n=1 Tax=Laticauda laticaudata TaxID=8630 RepID=A0A8C5RX71_LATLA
MLNKQIKEETEEWHRFQADLQTAVVVANDIKCEVQQELRAVKRRLLEEEEKTARLQKELEEVQGGSSRIQVVVFVLPQSVSSAALLPFFPHPLPVCVAAVPSCRPLRSPVPSLKGRFNRAPFARVLAAP